MFGCIIFCLHIYVLWWEWNYIDCVWDKIFLISHNYLQEIDIMGLVVLDIKQFNINWPHQWRSNTQNNETTPMLGYIMTLITDIMLTICPMNISWFLHCEFLSMKRHCNRVTIAYKDLTVYHIHITLYVCSPYV